MVVKELVQNADDWKTRCHLKAESSSRSFPIVFLAFPAGRFIGLAVDGMPSFGIIGALLLEIVIAALCLFAFRNRLLNRPIKP